MSDRGEIVEIEISEIDLFLINKVRKLRIDKKISQLKLSIDLGLAEGTVAKIENPKQRAKYNIRHLNLLAKALKCSISDLLPPKPLYYDLIKLKIRIKKNKGDEKGEPNYEIISKMHIKKMEKK